LKLLSDSFSGLYFRVFIFQPVCYVRPTHWPTLFALHYSMTIVTLHHPKVIDCMVKLTIKGP